MKLYMFRTVLLSIIRSLFTVNSAMVYATQLSSRTRMEHPGPARKLSTNLYDICHTYVMSYSFRAGPGYFILVLFESCLQICTTYTIAECTVNKLLMMDRRTVRNM